MRSVAQPLWRFMDFTKYVSLLHHRALFFARADHMPDPFEGLSGPWFRTRRGLEPARGPAKAFLSCWHQNDTESAAMWRVYLTGQDGVAIRTSAERLRAVLPKTERFEIGPVTYADAVPSQRAPRCFFYKRRVFDYEREVRAVWLCARDEPGRYLRVDLATLIGQVVVSPGAESWLLPLVKSVTRKYGFDFPVRRSALFELNPEPTVEARPPAARLRRRAPRPAPAR